MPKLKTKKSLKKRVHLTGTGKLLTRHMSITHRARFKSKRAKNNSAKHVTIASALSKKLRKVMI